MAVSAYWQAERFRTEQSLDTLEAVNGRFGLVAQQRVARPDSRHRILVSLAATLDTLPFGNAIVPQERERTELRATVEDSLLLDTVSARGLVGYIHIDGKGYPIGHLSGAVGRDIKLFASATTRVQSTSWMSREGWGDLITPGSAIAPSRIQLLEAGFKGKKSHLGFRTAAFFSLENDPVMLLQTSGTDTLTFVQGTEAVKQLGVSLRIGLREESERGFRASLSGTYLRRDGGSSSMYGERLNNQFPEFSGQARIGIRYLLFRGDLDLTVSVGGRAWSSLRSPVFHGPTGLFAIPLIENTTYGPSGYVDLNIKAVLRGATIFVAYENALSGLAYPGTFIVPLYPIASQRVRFGVLWPIWN